MNKILIKIIPFQTIENFEYFLGTDKTKSTSLHINIGGIMMLKPFNFQPGQ